MASSLGLFPGLQLGVGGRCWALGPLLLPFPPSPAWAWSWTQVALAMYLLMADSWGWEPEPFHKVPCPRKFLEQTSAAAGGTWERAWAKLPAHKGCQARHGAGRPHPSTAGHLPDAGRSKDKPGRLHLPVHPLQWGHLLQGWEPRPPRPPAPGTGLGTDGCVREACRAYVINTWGAEAGRYPGPKSSVPTLPRPGSGQNRQEGAGLLSPEHSGFLWGGSVIPSKPRFHILLGSQQGHSHTLS